MSAAFSYLGRIPRVLVVDDKPQNRQLLWAILVPEGYEVIEASDGLEALAILKGEEIDIVLLDVMMPGLDGIETCRRIRDDLQFVTLPVVFITALSDRLSRIRGQSVGGDDFLSKPIDEVELLVRVKNLLRAKAYHDLQKQNAVQLEREVDVLRDQLLRVERLATLGTLAGGVGHELNNILTVFEASLHFLRLRQARGEAPTARELEQLERVSQHIETHATQLLSLSRPGPDRAERFDLRGMILATVRMLEAAGRTRRVKVDHHFPPQAVHVLANRTRMEQVLVNLLLNAADATADSGRPRRIDIVLSTAGDRAQVHVADNGTGIPESVLDEIFDPYFTTKPADSGTGLGLPVVRRILEHIEGRVWVEQTGEEGSTFAFEIPVAPSDVSEDE